MMNSSQLLADALAELGRDPATRAAIIEALLAWESAHQTDGDPIRDRVTGPVVDQLHAAIPSIERQLQSGVMLALPYTSRIAREFAMARAPLDHVWEPQTTSLLLGLAGTARTIIVAGAYAGDHAILIADALRAKTGACLHCFDLDPRQITAITHNAQANRLDNLCINAIGLWDSPGHVVLEGEDSLGTAHAADEAASNAMLVTTVQDYATSHGITQIDLMMLDVEGAELRILRGALDFLSQPDDQAPDIVFEIHRHFTDWSEGLVRTDIVALLLSHGYHVYALRDIQGNARLSPPVIELVALDHVYLEGPPHGFNMFATRRPDTLERLGLVVRQDVSPKLLRHRLQALHQPGGDRGKVQ